MFLFGHGNELHMRYRSGLDSTYAYNDPVIVILDEVNRELRFTSRRRTGNEKPFILSTDQILSAGNQSVQTYRPGASVQQAVSNYLFPGGTAAETISSSQTKEEIWYVIRYCSDCFEHSIGLYDSMESPNFRKWDRRLQKLISGQKT